DDQRTAVDVDGHDVAAFRCHDLPIGGRRQGHDPIAHGVAAAAGGGDFGTGEAALEREAVAGEAVEGVHVRPPPGVHGGVAPGADVGVPGVNGGLKASVSVRGDPEAAVGGVPGDCIADGSAPELAECFALAGVV